MPGVAEGYAQIFLAFFLFWYSGFYLNAAITKNRKKIYTPPRRLQFLTVFSPPNIPGVAESYAQIFYCLFLFWYSVL